MHWIQTNNPVTRTGDETTVERRGVERPSQMLAGKIGALSKSLGRAARIASKWPLDARPSPLDSPARIKAPVKIHRLTPPAMLDYEIGVIKSFVRSF
jgi:hypothetical protein